MNNHSPDDAIPTEFTINLKEENYESVSTAIIQVIADHVGARPEKLDPLAESIDPFALDALFDPSRSSTPPDLKEITFQYHGIAVSVSSGHEIRFRPPQPHLLNW